MSGLIVDNIELSPYVAGVLSFHEELGIRLAVPFLRVDQFSEVKRWVRARKPPTNLLLMTDMGRFTLYNCRISASRENLFGNGVSTVEIAPQEVVYKDRDGDFDDKLEVTELRSNIDGLAEWTKMTATTFTVTHEDRRAKKVEVEVHAPPAVTIDINGITFEFAVFWKTYQDEPGFRIREWVRLSTRFEQSRPCLEHLQEQRKILALMTLLFGESIAFRGHEVRDDRFNTKVASGQVVDVPFYELVSHETVEDFSRTAPSLSRSIATFDSIGREGLVRWLEQYDVWLRMIEPSVGTLRRAESYAEDHLINASVSLEAAAQKLGPIEDEEWSYTPGRNPRPSTVTSMFRCLRTVGLDWSGVSHSDRAIARALAKAYNTVKHPNRGPLPPSEHLYTAQAVALIIVRLLVLRVVDPSMALVRTYGEGREFEELKLQIRQLNVYINSEGSFEDQSANGSDNTEGA